MKTMRIAAAAAAAFSLAGAALAATPAATPAATLPATVDVKIVLNCLPNAAALTLSDCKVTTVTPIEFTAMVSAGAIARTEATKMPANWATLLRKDGARVIVPVTVKAQRSANLPAAAAAAPASAGPQVVVTLSCIANPDLSVRDCQVLSTIPAASGAAAAALNSVSKAKLDANWRSVYKVENGRVILPVRLSHKAD